MGQKRHKKVNAKKKKAPREEDAALRLNHLIAASAILSEKAPSVSKFYARTSKQICRRVNMTLDSVSVKRMFCKKCNAMLVPGVGDPQPTYRIASRRERHLVVKCGNCGFVKRYLTRMPEQSVCKRKNGEMQHGENEVDSTGGKQRKRKSPEAMRKASSDDLSTANNKKGSSWVRWPSQECKVQ